MYLSLVLMYCRVASNCCVTVTAFPEKTDWKRKEHGTEGNENG